MAQFGLARPAEALALIEAAMLIALGFLCAALLSLALVPALARRADRLARRRAEAAFPLSLAEIAADRDHLRAELAVKMRAAEQQAERGFAAKAEALRDLGRRDMEIAGLKQELDGRAHRIAALEGSLAELQGERDRLEQDLAAERQAHGETTASFAQTTDDLAAREQNLARTAAELADTQAQLEVRSTALAEEQVLRQALEGRLRDTEASLARLSDDHERLRVAQVEDRTRIMVLEGKRDELADALAATGSSLSRAEAELLVLAAERDGQRERGDAFAARIAQAEAGLAAADSRASAAAAELQQLRRRHQEEAAAMQDEQRERDARLETLRAELQMLEGALAQARADGAEARAELAALRKTAGSEGGGRLELRREIVRLADSLMETPAKRQAAE